MRGSPDMAPHIANGARRAPGSRKNRVATPSDENYEYEKQEDPNTSHRSTKGTGASGLGRSFSTRAQDYPEGNLNYTTRKPVPPSASEELDDSTTPRNLPTEDYPSGPSADMPQIQQPVSPPAQGLGPPPSRSNTTRSTKNVRKDWASDRSPLQKLEVTLTGISKEEKRARVQKQRNKPGNGLRARKPKRRKTNQWPQWLAKHQHNVRGQKRNQFLAQAGGENTEISWLRNPCAMNLLPQQQHHQHHGNLEAPPCVTAERSLQLLSTQQSAALKIPNMPAQKLLSQHQQSWGMRPGDQSQ